MVDIKFVRRSVRYSALAGLCGLGACTSVLGIEDLHEEARPGAGSNPGGSSSSNGGSQPQGGSASSNGGTTPSSGTSSTEGGAPEQPTGGSGTSGGTGGTTGGTVSEGGAGGEPTVVQDPTVHGTLIDYYGHPLSNVIVTVAGQPVPTDKDGHFTAENVPNEYDATLRITREISTKQYGWAFIGLTRRDPTLQIYQRLDDGGTTGYVKVTSPTLLTNDTVSASLGTVHGANEKKTLTTNDQYGNYFSADWQGPNSIMGTMHGLLWAKDGTTDLPTSYKGYDSKLVALAEGTPLDISLNLAKQTIPSAAIAGTVTPNGNGDRRNFMFVRFDSGASIQVVEHTPTANAFSYVAPTLPKASITIAASEGAGYEDPFSIVHKNGLSPGSAAGTLKIPAPATPIAPNSADIMVDETTDFSFSGSVDSKGAFVVALGAVKYYDYFYIVTSKKKLKLPQVPGFSWEPGRVFAWRVETHGQFATVDEMAGPTGFADEFTGPNVFSDYTAPQPSTHQGDGSFTMSAEAYFTRK